MAFFAAKPYHFLLFLSFSVWFFITNEALEGDRIVNLSGQPTYPSVSHFSGYITVNPEHGRYLFYWFFEAQEQPLTKPLLLWLNGGPGCSSVGYGATTELGPFRVEKNGHGLEFNKYSWNKQANLLFLESPVGVGFSYTNTASDFNRLDDQFVAEDAYNFLVNWLKRYPQFKDNDFYMSGESYAGHYVPQLAELVYDRNKERNKYPFINLKGFMVGNPETDGYYDSKGLIDYAWSHAVISDQTYQTINGTCNFTGMNLTDECSDAVLAIFQQYREIDIYNIYALKCLTNDTISSKLYKAGRNNLLGLRIPAGYDPCYSSYVEDFFNRADVQKSLHVNKNNNGRWRVCNDSILRRYNFTVFSTVPIYTKLIKAGLRIWVYSGDADGRVPVLGTRYWISALNRTVKTSWRPWYHKKQVGGRLVEYDGLTFVTIRGAGHLVPLNKPSEALALIHSFLSGKSLPIYK